MPGIRKLLLMALATAVLAPSADAATGPVIPPSNPVANQYVEVVPTAGGGRQVGIGPATGTGASRSTSSPGGISAATQTALYKQGRDGIRTDTLAQASAPRGPGVPRNRISRLRGGAGRGGSTLRSISAGPAGNGSGEAGRSPIGTLAGSLTGSGTAGLGALFPLALGLIVLCIAGIAVQRRRAR